MTLYEIVVREVQCNRCFKVFQFLAKCVGQACQSAHVKPSRSIQPLNIAGRCQSHVRESADGLFLRNHKVWCAVLPLGIGGTIVDVSLDDLREVYVGTKRLIVALVGAFIAMMQPVQEREDASNTQNTQKTGKQESPPETQSVKPKEPLTPSSDNQKARKEDQSRAANKASDWQEATTPATWSNWALAVIGFFGVLAALWTLLIIRRQTKAAEVAAVAAKASTDILTGSERAWVLVETAQIREIQYQTSVISPVIRNFGKSITRVHKVKMGFSSLQITEALPHVPIYGEAQELDFVLHPDRQFQPIDIPISQAGLQAVVDGLKLLYVYGVIEYLSGTTGFCLLYCQVKGNIPAGFYPAVKAPGAYTSYQ